MDSSQIESLRVGEIIVLFPEGAFTIEEGRVVPNKHLNSISSLLILSRVETQVMSSYLAYAAPRGLVLADFTWYENEIDVVRVCLAAPNTGRYRFSNYIRFSKLEHLR